MMSVPRSEYDALERKHLKVTSEMYTDIQKLRKENELLPIYKRAYKAMTEFALELRDRLDTIEDQLENFPDWDVGCEECGCEISDAYCASIIDTWLDEVKATIKPNEVRRPE